MQTQGKITNTAMYLATLGLTGVAGQNFILSKNIYDNCCKFKNEGHVLQAVERK